MAQGCLEIGESRVGEMLTCDWVRKWSVVLQPRDTRAMYSFATSTAGLPNG
jgi:hypothetical protein